MTVVQNLLDEIDSQTAPSRMNKQQALDTLEELRDELVMRLDALRSEVAAEMDDPAPAS